MSNTVCTTLVQEYLVVGYDHKGDPILVEFVEAQDKDRAVDKVFYSGSNVGYVSYFKVL